jgi:hypothetical protein
MAKQPNTSNYPNQAMFDLGLAGQWPAENNDNAMRRTTD